MEYKPPVPEPVHRLRRDDNGNAVGMQDASGTPRYLYSDGSMDMNSSVNTKNGFVLAVAGCELAPESPSSVKVAPKRKVDPEVYENAVTHRKQVRAKYGKSIVKAALPPSLRPN
jgi:hypothetical protein